MKIIDELKSRGIIKDITNEDKLNRMPKDAKVYIGFDPTAESLHLGNYVQISILKRFQNHGIKAVAILGGATGMIGDPSGRTTERKFLSSKELNLNKDKIRAQLESFGIEVIDNYNFYKDMNVLEFLRDTGKLLNVKYMINKENVKSRLDEGMTFTEFAYQLMQGWDFKKLYDDHNVMIQFGGSDQWGNITAGVEIIRKTVGDKNTAVGITSTLLTDSNGKKFGKSTGGALWLDKNMYSPYKIYQYLLNTSDKDVEKLLLWLSFKTEQEIKDIMEEHNLEPFKRIAQKELAKAIIIDIHSKEDFNKAIELSEALFTSNKTNLTVEDYLQLEGSIPTINSKETDLQLLIVESGASKSKREAREFLAQGAVVINGQIMSEDSTIPNAKVLLIKRGKKNHFLIKR